jgi:hypothetical protein
LKLLLIIPFIGCILAAASNEALNKVRAQAFYELHAEFVVKQGMNERVMMVVLDVCFLILVLYFITLWPLIILGRMLKHFVRR